MPLFRVNNNRHIDTDQIADIHYRPASSATLNFGAGPIQPFASSSLTIELKTTETIELDAEEADAAWAAYNAVTGLT